MPATIKLDSLRDLISARSVQDVALIGAAPDGFALQVRVGMETRVLQTKRDKIRFFKNLETARRFIRNDLGLARFTVDTANMP